MIALTDRLRPRGHTLFELGVVACLFATLVGIFLTYVPRYRAEAEGVQARQVVAALRSALSARAAQVAAMQGEAGLRALAMQNPVEWLQRPPENYLGEYYRPDAALLSAGHWYFDRADRTLVYFPNRYKSFSSESSKLLRIKVKFLSLPSSAAKSGRSVETMGLALEEID